MDDAAHLVRTITRADGVLVIGCHLGECHYLEGNYMASKRIAVLKKLLAFTGINPDRLRVEWLSSAESPTLVRVVTDFSKQIKAIGPSRLKIRA